MINPINKVAMIVNQQSKKSSALAKLRELGLKVKKVGSVYNDPQTKIVELVSKKGQPMGTYGTDNLYRYSRGYGKSKNQATLDLLAQINAKNVVAYTKSGEKIEKQIPKLDLISM